MDPAAHRLAAALEAILLAESEHQHAIDGPDREIAALLSKLADA